jgi:hypothetical protein
VAKEIEVQKQNDNAQQPDEVDDLLQCLFVLGVRCHVFFIFIFFQSERPFFFFFLRLFIAASGDEKSNCLAVTKS